MSTSVFAKRMIAEGLKEMLKTENLESISIGSLARHCQVGRSTIYYHFKDKYDIISWIFNYEITPVLNAAPKVGSWTDNLMALCLYLQENREFYIKVLHESGQNSFYECLIDFCRELILQMFRESGGPQILDPDQIQVISILYSHGIVGLIQEWSQSRMEADPAPVVKTVKDLISGAVFDRMLTGNQTSAM